MLKNNYLIFISFLLLTACNNKSQFLTCDSPENNAFISKHTQEVISKSLPDKSLINQFKIEVNTRTIHSASDSEHQCSASIQVFFPKSHFDVQKYAFNFFRDTTEIQIDGQNNVISYSSSYSIYLDDKEKQKINILDEENSELSAFIINYNYLKQKELDKLYENETNHSNRYSQDPRIKVDNLF